MVRKALPYDAGGGANVQEADWVLMTQWFMSPGVYLDALGGMGVYADSSGKQVKIHTGEAWAYGTFFYNTDSPDFILGPFPDNPSGNPRIDRVVLRFDWTTNSADFVLLVGNPAASPTPPTPANAPGVVWDLKLAQVNIAAGYTTIAAGNVVDERVNAVPRVHDLQSTHTVSGLTSGHHLRATSATTFAFGATQLADLPTITQALSAVGTTSNATTTSTANVDMPEMTVPGFTTVGGDLLCWFYSMWSVDTAAVQARFYWNFDGTDTLIGVPHEPFANYEMPIMSVRRFTGVAAGAHTVKIRWSTGSNTLQANGVSRFLLVTEVRK
jgi:hypothetical protein